MLYIWTQTETKQQQRIQKKTQTWPTTVEHMQNNAKETYCSHYKLKVKAMQNRSMDIMKHQDVAMEG